jgi:phage shock protein A
VTKPNPIPERVNKLEQQMTEVDRKADDALTLARGADNDVADFRTELRAHRKSLEALRENQLDMQAEMHDMRTEMGDMRTEMRDGFSTVGVGMAQITALLTTAIGRPDEPPS